MRNNAFCRSPCFDAVLTDDVPTANAWRLSPVTKAAIVALVQSKLQPNDLIILRMLLDRFDDGEEELEGQQRERFEHVQ